MSRRHPHRAAPGGAGLRRGHHQRLHGDGRHRQVLRHGGGGRGLHCRRRGHRLHLPHRRPGPGRRPRRLRAGLEARQPGPRSEFDCSLWSGWPGPKTGLSQPLTDWPGRHRRRTPEEVRQDAGALPHPALTAPCPSWGSGPSSRAAAPSGPAWSPAMCGRPPPSPPTWPRSPGRLRPGHLRRPGRRGDRRGGPGGERRAAALCWAPATPT